jgi:Co/Zn/Cd efflux system component
MLPDDELRLRPKRSVRRHSGGTQWIVIFFLVVNAGEMFALAVAGWVTGSGALIAQSAANAAELGVSVFLLIGVVRSNRPPDETHPLGYGRERFFWSLFAALDHLAFEPAELAEIDRFAVEGDVNLWAPSSNA